MFVKLPDGGAQTSLTPTLILGKKNGRGVTPQQTGAVRLALKVLRGVQRPRCTPIPPAEQQHPYFETRT